MKKKVYFKKIIIIYILIKDNVIDKFIKALDHKYFKTIHVIIEMQPEDD